MFLWVTGSVKAINNTQCPPSAQSTSHLQIITWDFLEYECALVEIYYGSSDSGAAMTLLMFPLASVIVVRPMPQGGGLVWNRGRRGALVEREQTLWIHTFQTHILTSQRIQVLLKKPSGLFFVCWTISLIRNEK